MLVGKSRSKIYRCSWVVLFLQIYCNWYQLEVPIFCREADARKLCSWQEEQAFLYTSYMLLLWGMNSRLYSEKSPQVHTQWSDCQPFLFISLLQKCLERLRSKEMEKRDPEPEIEFSPTSSAKTTIRRVLTFLRLLHLFISEASGPVQTEGQI